MKAGFPPNAGSGSTRRSTAAQSVLLHKQADNVWRIDFQLGWDADPEEEKKPENVIPRIRAMLGPEAEFELEWVSVYQFACRRMDNFRHGRVLFAGDAAHQVSPFGARGANTGVQDIDNLAWKLKLVLDGLAPRALVDSYDEERAWAADDNLLNSTRSTDFITPKSAASRAVRDAVLELAKTEPFARPLVNSGRLSTPTPYAQSGLNTADTEDLRRQDAPGHRLRRRTGAVFNGQAGWFLAAARHTPGSAGDFTLLVFGDEPGRADQRRPLSTPAAGASGRDLQTPGRGGASATTPSPAPST
jgi:3-(3-hydroxy-phenyl)propionate hydroxylase